MREWIRLFEDDGFAELVKGMKAHDAPYADVGYGYTIDGDAFEITDAHVADMRRNIEEILKQSPTIYRYVLLRPADLDRYLSGSLGVYWCYDWEIDVAALTGWDSSPDDAELYRLRAQITIGDVEMSRTVFQNLAAPWEHEITLKSGAEIKLIGVDLLPNSDPVAHPVKQPFPRQQYRA